MPPGAENHWERFASEDAEFYIWARDRSSLGDTYGQEFLESGRRESAALFELVEHHLLGRALAVEIGCGVGRLAIPMASRFDRLVAVDIAPTMLAKLQEKATSAGIANIATALLPDPWEQGTSADFVYSWGVFQHVGSMQEIDDIVGRISQKLGSHPGLALLQFDTRPRTIGYRMKTTLPDVVLPRVHRRGIRRIRRASRDLREMFGKHGLSIVEESAPDDAWHIFLLRNA